MCFCEHHEQMSAQCTSSIGTQVTLGSLALPRQRYELTGAKPASMKQANFEKGGSKGTINDMRPVEVHFALDVNCRIDQLSQRVPPVDISARRLARD